MTVGKESSSTLKKRYVLNGGFMCSVACGAWCGNGRLVRGSIGGCTNRAGTDASTLVSFAPSIGGASFGGGCGGSEDEVLGAGAASSTEESGDVSGVRGEDEPVRFEGSLGCARRITAGSAG